MAVNLQIDQALTPSAQSVKDEGGGTSPLALSSAAVGIGTTAPEVPLHISGDVLVEKNGSPKLAIQSHGYGTQHYSLRVTNNQDSAGGRLFVIRNEDHGRDDLVLDNAGNIRIPGDMRLERNGSPKLGIQSHGYGTQHYSLRATNNRDSAGGRRFVIRNEDANDGQGRDEIVLDSAGNVTFSGDIILSGADCAEEFDVENGSITEPGTVMVIGQGDRLRHCETAYFRRVVGVIAGAGGQSPAIVLGHQQSGATRIRLALVGKALCKVDASYAEIDVGDLLTTSPTPGHAMKADIPEWVPGAVLGKALRPLANGRGLVPILVALQ
jgi:hypothetical protein